DYVVGSGRTRSVRDLAEVAFGHVGLDWREHVEVDQAFMRPAEVEVLQADATKARSVLGWEPKLNFEQLVSMMVDADLQRLSRER
ncbi:MAG: GDP-mannose 4,6-dehydratase, partial [Gemmatimonadota bacterium]